jgi:V/A-type H+-transporting ATPase subunit I
MLRPERMSKVSVTGAKSVMDEVVDTVHDMRLLHVTEYDGSWAGFQPGDPVEGAERASERLVTVRSLESILDIDAADVDAAPRSLDDETLGERLERVRTRVNDLDDRRSDIRDELGTIEERLDGVEPFAALGIDLDLLQGYDAVQVAVGEGDRDGVERALLDAGSVSEYGIFEADADSNVIAIVAHPTDDDPDALTDALVGTNFSALPVPDLESVEAVADDGPSYDPDTYVRNLRRRRETLQQKLETVETELAEVRAEEAEFLLAAEEKLSIDVQRAEAPLTFATTANAFVAEGWIPTSKYTDFAGRLQSAVGEHVEVEELERAEFNHDGSDHAREEVGGAGDAPTRDRDGPEPGEPAVADGGAGGSDRDARADGGGVVTMRDDEPPVVQDNPDAVKPFEVLTRAVGLPNYSEFDPTIILFLTFPALFGFMIGDLGYGLIYTGIGLFIASQFDSDALRSMGGVTIAAGLFTILFGILYGEIFGLHLISTYFWEGLLGMSHPPMEKGLSPAGQSFAITWLLVSVLFGVLHLTIGFVLDFVENYQLHGPRDAILESGSWLLMLNGLWIFVLSRAAVGNKPPFLFTVLDGSGAAPEAGGGLHAAYELGFNGFSAGVGWAALGLFGLGILLIILSGEVGEAIEAIFGQVLINGLSYTRLTAVLLAKAGMAFAVNLLFFGVYVTDEGPEAEFHFALDHMPEVGTMSHGHEVTEILFGGLVHSGPAAVVVGLLVLVFGHLLVLALGVTSAGLQAIRLEYVEFFGKFYEGSGRTYSPFGLERRFTSDD